MNHISKLVNQGNLKEALEEMGKYPSQFPSNQVIQTQARLSGLNQNIRLGIVSHSDAQINRNQITSAIVSFLESAGVSVEEEPQPIRKRMPQDKLNKIQSDLESIVKQIMFDREYKEEKTQAKALVQKVKDYRIEKIQDSDYDIEETKQVELEQEYLGFHEKFQLRLKNRRKVKVKEIEGYLEKAEDDLSKQTLTDLAAALVAFNSDLRDFRPIIEKASEIQLEAIAQDMASVVFGL